MYDLLKRMQSDLFELKQSQASMAMQFASMEQHMAAYQLDIARLGGDMVQVKSDIRLIKRRLDLVDA